MSPTNTKVSNIAKIILFQIQVIIRCISMYPPINKCTFAFIALVFLAQGSLKSTDGYTYFIRLIKVKVKITYSRSPDIASRRVKSKKSRV